VTTAALTTTCAGLGPSAPADPCVIVICGATGDLTRRELIPALFELFTQKLLPESCTILGFSRSTWGDDGFRTAMRNAMVASDGKLDRAAWDRFAGNLGYVSGDFTAPADGAYANLSRRIKEIRTARHIPDNVLFHLATPPAAFPTIVGRLGASGLAQSETGWRRLVIEKPFGTDAASAAALDQAVRAVFAEEQIYRIDHFLGKETVQNMLVVRFANPMFEPIWNRDHIDHVQITVAEEIGIGTRAAFYEQTGVVRDMVQNHLLQLLCMTAIEPPNRFDASALRTETAKVLEAVQPLALEQDCVAGQYAGYRAEPGVAPDSSVATYAALKLGIDNWRWAGVPFYLRTGKRMARQLTEVAITFRPTPHVMFPVNPAELHKNVLSFRLQPDEGIIQTFAAKQPGPEVRITPVTMTFSYASAFGVTRPPRAYAWLLLDAMKGDGTLFARADWIQQAWRIVDPLIAQWERQGARALQEYRAGSWGPTAADDLLKRDRREWRAI
jgi:glucose-6-phosphate 1-dehydrogenase